MATVNFYQTADMSNPTVWYGYVDSYSASHITLTNYSGKTGTYYGSFSYNAYGLAGGTVTGYDNYTNYSLDVTVRGVSVNALVLNNWLNNGDALAIHQYALRGNDVISGSAGADTLLGWGGNDTLNGGTGADSMVGDVGNDTYIVDDIGDAVWEYLDEGIDTVKSSVDYTLLDNFENLTLLGSATYGIGNSVGNTIIGNASSNLLDGLGGNDVLLGGAGNDIYVVDSMYDKVFETTTATSGINAGGIDGVESSVSWTLGSFVEELMLTGSDDINGTGNTLNNLITGNSGNNALNGGLGADTMVGGNGNDSYIVNSSLDVITENSDEGIDSASASTSYVLSANVENLTLTGTAATNATGNDLNNILTGNAAANILDGLAGADTMNGGKGNDTYIVDDPSDTVMESLTIAQGGGIDTVKSSITFMLGTNIDRVILTGTDNINGTGNMLNNILTGNTGSNSLDGGAGVDVLQGGLGNDTYTVDLVQTGTTAAAFRVALQDTVTEAANAGNDSLILRGNFSHINATTLTLVATLENFDASQTGTTKLNLTGNALNNILTGNDANNILNGGAGADTLTGGSGADTFDFNFIAESPKGVGRDVITDFDALELDRIDLLTIDANTLLVGNQAFSFIGVDTAFSNVAGQLSFNSVSYLLSGDVNGDAISDFEIALTGVTTLASSDFIL